MQDKDMDQLFRSQLDNYEIEPSSKVWAGVAAGLDADEHKKAGFPFLRVAASVAILATASYMFWPKGDQQNGADRPKQMASAVKTDVKPVQQQPTTVVEEQTAVSEPVKQDQQVKPVVNAQPKQAIAAVNHPAVKQDPTVNNQPATTVVDPTPAVVVNTQQQQVLASVETPKNETPVTQNTNAVVPDDIKFVPAIDQQVVTKPAVVVASQTPAKKNKIRGLGGLLNAAISLVDRRDDKIVEFTNNEDGDTITGINLGIVSFKKEKK